jgi:hypothetical protein
MPVDITEYAELARDAMNLTIPAGQEPATAEQQVAIGGGSVQSAAFASTTRFVRLHADAACRIAFGVNPTAAGTSRRLAAGQTEYFGVIGGQKVAVITST